MIEKEDGLLYVVLPCVALLEGVELVLCHHSRLTLWYMLSQ